MKTVYTISAFVFLLFSCAGSKKYDTSPTAGSVEKLIKKHNRKPEDTAVLNRLVFGYNLLHQQYMQEIDALSISNTPQAWESIAGLYSKLTDLNANAARNSDLYELLQPKNYTADMQNARLRAAEGYYGYATDLLKNDNWSDAREATTYLNKVKNLGGNNYKDLDRLIRQAKEAGIVNILIQPLRTEGIYINSGYYAYQHGNRLSDQLVSDMGGEWNNYGRYRVFSADRYYNKAKDPDWIAEPVWTNWSTSPVQYNTSKRTVTAQKQTGTDSLRRPIYKTISAVISITQVTINADGRLEFRINDVKNRSMVNNRTWNESYCWSQSYASYTGDRDALSDEDWNLVQQQRNNLPSDDQLQSEIIKKIYPDMLRWFKNVAE